MTAFDIEELRLKLVENMDNALSDFLRLYLITDYLVIVANTKNPLFYSFLLEFLDEYILLLNNFQAECISPVIIKNLLINISTLKKNIDIPESKQKFEKVYQLIVEKYNNLLQILNGKEFQKDETKKLLFPVLEKDVINQGDSFGILESLTIKITKGKKEDKFIIVPQIKRVDEILKHQIETSWKVALQYVKKEIRNVAGYHDVIINFDKQAGNYVGNSLGVVLSIGFIEELLNFYNAPFLVSIKSNTASTGSIDDKGKINSITDKVIEEKVEKVFYSSVENFIIPDRNKIAGEEKLNELKKDYPNRKLNLISVKDLEDLLNRRNLIDIRKQNPIIRTAKAAKKNYVALILLFLLILLSSYYAVRDIDDNPAILEGRGKTLLVKNKEGKILWTKEFDFYRNHWENPVNYHMYCILSDVNNDGEKELLVSRESFPDSLIHFLNRIACFDKNNNLIWQYIFKDSVRTQTEIMQPFYTCQMIGLIKYNNKNVLVCQASNIKSFASAIFSLDPATGKRIGGTLWNPGTISSGVVRETTKDNCEVICNMFNNDYERTGMFVVDLDKVEGTTPYKRETYHLLGTEIANLKAYILFQNSDYNKYHRLRNNRPNLGVIIDEGDSPIIKFEVIEDNFDNEASLGYEFNYNLRDFTVTVGATFRVRRDTLVAHSKLKPPLSDTPEYCELLRSQIIYWNGKKFVKREELK